ncbi:hypothetical protein WJX77_007341 [Trebouxia sp. C0004]
MEGLSSDLPGPHRQPEADNALLGQILQQKPDHASSVSLSSPEQSEPDSDFETDGAGPEAGLSRPGSSDGEASDDSTYGAVHRKRRKTQHNKPVKRVRPELDNEQTRKLRSALPSEEPSAPGGQDTNGYATSNMQGSESAAAAAALEESQEEEEESDSQSRPVERRLTAEQHAEQLRQVQSMWQMAAVLEFLHTFSLYLQLRGSFTPEELEVAIVSEAAQTGLLANLHQDLLRGITSRADWTSENWSAHFANRLKYQWTSTHLRGSPPFYPLKRSEASDYAALHATDRVLALKLLCEIRLDKEDLRSAIELSMKPPKAPSRPPSGKTRAAGASTRGRSEPAPEVVMDVRHEPLGESDKGVMYWYLDLGPSGHTSLTGVRLYKEILAEVPPSPPLPKPRGKEASGAKGKGAKRRGNKAKIQGGLGGSLVPPPAEPSWELLCSSTEELQAVGEDLTGSEANTEADIGYQLLDDIVPTLVARAEALEKRARAAAKIAAQLNNVVPDDSGHYGRSRRQRTQVNYNYDEYDRTIKDAIRGGRHEVLLPSARPQRDWSRPAPIESRRAGLRGGKPEEGTHSSPDENRPSNDQSGAPDSGTDRPDSDSNAESEHQAPSGVMCTTWPGGSMDDNEMQNGQGDYNPCPVGHTGWGAHTAASHGYQRSFAVPSEPLNRASHANDNSCGPSYLT